MARDLLHDLTPVSRRGVTLGRRKLDDFFASSGAAQFERTAAVVVVLTGILVGIVALMRIWNCVERRRNQNADVTHRRGGLVRVGDRGLVVERGALNDKNLGFVKEQLLLLGETFKFDALGLPPEQEGSFQESGNEETQNPTATGKESRLKECIVCLVEYEQGELLRKLHACGHVFHQDCVDAWLRCHRFCPFCRTPLSLDQQQHPPQNSHQ